jgi:hypothetical protein
VEILQKSVVIFRLQPKVSQSVCRAIGGVFLFAAQKDFRKQKGRLQEELEAAGQEVISYPSFIASLNISGILVNGMYENIVSIL